MQYPDRWTGPAAYQSTGIYPDRWPAESERFSEGVSHAYKYSETVKAVPAFVTQPKDIIKQLSQISRPSVKRGLNDSTISIEYGLKRLKREDSAVHSIVGSLSNHVIDLTLDEKEDSGLRNALQPITNNVSTRIHAYYQTSKPLPRHRYISQNMLLKTHQRAARNRRDRSTRILGRVATNMFAIAGDINADRNILRERWEVDDDLKKIQTTDDLATLNKCFVRIESAVEDGTRIIEEKLRWRK